MKLFVALDRYDVVVPGKGSMGRAYTGYLLLATVLHHTVYFILRSIPLGDWSVLVAKILLSSLLTLMFMLVAEYSFVNSGSKRSTK